MTMRNEILAKSFTAGGAIGRARLVRFGADAQTVVQATGPAETILGVLCSDAPTGAAAGRGADVIVGGVATVEFGGVVTAGALLTADTDGRAVMAAPAAGVKNSIIGVAMVAGAAGTRGAVLISTGQVKGEA